MGDRTTFTCNSLLGQADTIEWLLSETVVETINDQTTLDLVFDPVSESMNNRVYRCRVTIGGESVDQNVTVMVQGEPLLSINFLCIRPLVHLFLLPKFPVNCLL